VLGNIVFGINFSVLKGENNLGIVNLKLAPISLMSKNWSVSFAPSLEAPIDASPEISRVSAPLNIFLTVNAGLKEKPIV